MSPSVICPDYDGAPWNIVTDPCWTGATGSQKVDLLVQALLFASVVMAFVIGYVVMKK